jgi:hypothetical protein
MENGTPSAHRELTIGRIPTSSSSHLPLKRGGVRRELMKKVELPPGMADIVIVDS